MSNAYETVRSIIDEARSLNYAVEQSANVLTDLLIKNLRKVDGWRLKELKRELRKFNMVTQEWDK